MEPKAPIGTANNTEKGTRPAFIQCRQEQKYKYNGNGKDHNWCTSLLLFLPGSNRRIHIHIRW